MAGPYRVTGAKYQFLRYRVTGYCLEADGIKRPLQFACYYGPSANSCGGSGNTQSQKTTLCQTAVTGFQAVVATPIIAIMNKGWVNQGIFGKWIDQITDPDVPCDTLAITTAGNGGIGTLPSRLPLDVHVTMRKYTALAGKKWKGNWKFPCVDSSYIGGGAVPGDELNAAGIAAWQAIKALLLSTISDGTSTLYPILVSQTESQLRLNPTRVAYGTLAAMPTIKGVANPMLDVTLGEMKRRKEKIVVYA